MEVKAKDKILSLLKADKRIWDEKKTELNQTKLLDLIDKEDEKIINLLFTDTNARKIFFNEKEKGKVYIFKSNKFKFFIEENTVYNSYTQYKNRIGLTDGDRFIKDTNDVVLDFPFKDCVLQGGQSREEENDAYYEYDEKVSKNDAKKYGHQTGKYNLKHAKREEIFFNQVLAQDEIDRLFDEKALVGWNRYTKKGKQQINEIKKEEGKGAIKENLIIKGNNLLALHSLKKQFAGKVKLIYIDPPYNTGGDKDSFTYNNNFNHSAWLTFIKNRLEAAKQLLREDGFIAIAIDHCELLYLGTLADEIFGRDNRLGIVTVVHKPEGRSQENFFGASNEFMLVYAKNQDNAIFRKIVLNINDNRKDTYKLNDDIGKYKYRSFIRGESKKEDKPSLFYPIYVSKDLKDISINKKHAYKEIYPVSNNVERAWFLIPESLEGKIKNGEIIAEKNKNNEIKIKYMVREREVFVTHWTAKKYNAISHGTKLLEKTIDRKSFSYPKSLYLIVDILKLMTADNDIILDFFAGSGTTGHATLALNKEDGGNRKFILVEQLDEHLEVCIERNSKVLEKENIDDSFVYVELAAWNEQAKEKIMDCKNLKELEKLFSKLYDKYFLNYNLKIRQFRNDIIKQEKFCELSLEEQKKMFLTMLDLNQMYVHRSEMKDLQYKISDKDIELTESFYNNN